MLLLMMLAYHSQSNGQLLADASIWNSRDRPRSQWRCRAHNEIICRQKLIKPHLHLSSFMATNNFVALLGMFVLYKTQVYLPLDVYQRHVRHFCAFRVVWRFFGLNSGCIALVMSTERWLALTRPFIYRKIVTPSVTAKTLIGFSVLAALLSIGPLAGFGVYFSEETNTCLRYRDGRDPIDVAYAFTFFSFGECGISNKNPLNSPLTRTRDTPASQDQFQLNLV